MTNLQKKLAASAITVAILGTAFAPSTFAATTIEIKDNGADSTNKVKVTNKKKVAITQKNKANVSNITAITQNTGGNKANKNTGGSVTITTGDATASVTNTTTTGNNVANVDLCECVDGDLNVTVSGNGSDSYNKVKVKSVHSTTYSQKTYTNVTNGTEIDQNTGDNKANKNTNGDVEIVTGTTDVAVENNVTTGDNYINP